MNDIYLHLNDDEWEMRKMGNVNKLDCDGEREILAGDIVLTSIKELEAEIMAWRARDKESEAMLLHLQERIEAAEIRAARLTEALRLRVAENRIHKTGTVEEWELLNLI